MYVMLTQGQTQQFAQSAQISADNILKEHYQMFLLDILFKSNLSNGLIFKGGTALKLVYNSFRYSEDLDFSLAKKIEFVDFKKLVFRIPRVFPEAEVKDLDNKINTYFARICFKLDYKPIPIGIKIEINKDIKKRRYQASLIKSQFNNIAVTGDVFELSEMLHDKYELLEARREPRDLFDLWYIHQLLGKQFVIENRYKYGQKEIMDKLNPFISLNHKKILSLFIK